MPNCLHHLNILRRKDLTVCSHHHDIFDACRLCNQDYIPTTSATRLPPLPPSSIYNTTQVAIPMSYSSSVSPPHHSTGESISPCRPILDNDRVVGYRDHRTIPLGVTTSHVTRHGTPSPPSSHLQYRNSIDSRRLSPHLPYGKCISFHTLIIYCQRPLRVPFPVMSVNHVDCQMTVAVSFVADKLSFKEKDAAIHYKRFKLTF